MNNIFMFLFILGTIYSSGSFFFYTVSMIPEYKGIKIYR